jgi:hypothetical protein
MEERARSTYPRTKVPERSFLSMFQGEHGGEAGEAEGCGVFKRVKVGEILQTHDGPQPIFQEGGNNENQRGSPKRTG